MHTIRDLWRGSSTTWWTVLALALTLALAGCPEDDDDSAGDDDTGDDDTEFSLWSDKFDEGDPIPLEHSCDNKAVAQGVSPHLAWANPPKGTKYFAITVFDPDADDTPHWGVFDIPATTLEFADGLRPDNPFPDGGWEAVVYTGAEEYAGPCPPPPHKPHTYEWTVHAMDGPMPDYFTTPNLADMGSDIAKREIGTAMLTGTYDRP